MRLLTTLFATCFAIFFLPGVGAFHRGKSLTKRGDHNVSPVRSSVLAQRQRHTRRNLIDLCISLDATALATLIDLVDPLHADVHLCLCLQVIVFLCISEYLRLYVDHPLGLGHLS
jgi:hypothetical protein